jgi:histidine triad (HIT) family protein
VSADGVSLRQNSGDASGQDVNHFHMHVVPRHEGDVLGRACVWGLAPWKPPKGGERKRRQVADALRGSLA